MREKLFEILETIGVSFSEKEKASMQDIDLSEHISESFTMVMFALEVEKQLGVVLDDSFFKEEHLKSFNGIVELLSNGSASAE